MSKKSSKKKKVKRKKRDRDIKIDQILLNNRQLFLSNNINDKTANSLIRELIALDKISSEPIALYINSGGGYLDAGFAIIDIIMGLRANIVTVIFGSACSMAGLIAIAGRYRIISKHSVIMFHDMWTGMCGTPTTIEDRSNYVKELQKKVFDYLRERTKLSKADLEKVKNGELWLSPGKALEKGVVNQILA